MKKTAFVLTLLLTATVAFSQVTPQTIAEAECKVEAKVVPNITVECTETDGVVSMGTLGSFEAGEVCAEVPFLVHANTEAVYLQICATHLYKGGKTDPNTPTIPLVVEKGAVISGEITQIGTADNTLPFDTSSRFDSHGLAGYCTEVGCFENGDTGTFTVNFTATVCWQNDDPELPVGWYFGYVKLIAEVCPDNNPV